MDYLWYEHALGISKHFAEYIVPECLGYISTVKGVKEFESFRLFGVRSKHASKFSDDISKGVSYGYLEIKRDSHDNYDVYATPLLITVIDGLKDERVTPDRLSDLQRLTDSTLAPTREKLVGSNILDPSMTLSSIGSTSNNVVDMLWYGKKVSNILFDAKAVKYPEYDEHYPLVTSFGETFKTNTATRIDLNILSKYHESLVGRLHRCSCDNCGWDNYFSMNEVRHHATIKCHNFVEFTNKDGETKYKPCNTALRNTKSLFLIPWFMYLAKIDGTIDSMDCDSALDLEPGRYRCIVIGSGADGKGQLTIIAAKPLHTQKTIQIIQPTAARHHIYDIYDMVGQHLNENGVTFRTDRGRLIGLCILIQKMMTYLKDNEGGYCDKHHILIQGLAGLGKTFIASYMSEVLYNEKEDISGTRMSIPGLFGGIAEKYVAGQKTKVFVQGALQKRLLLFDEFGSDSLLYGNKFGSGGNIDTIKSMMVKKTVANPVMGGQTVTRNCVFISTRNHDDSRLAVFERKVKAQFRYIQSRKQMNRSFEQKAEIRYDNGSDFWRWCDLLWIDNNVHMEKELRDDLKLAVKQVVETDIKLEPLSMMPAAIAERHKFGIIVHPNQQQDEIRVNLSAAEYGEKIRPARLYSAQLDEYIKHLAEGADKVGIDSIQKALDASTAQAYPAMYMWSRDFAYPTLFWRALGAINGETILSQQTIDLGLGILKLLWKPITIQQFHSGQ
jgi:hypothetical protein